MKKIYLFLLISFLFLLGGMIFVYKSQKNQVTDHSTQMKTSPN